MIFDGRRFVQTRKVVPYTPCVCGSREDNYLAFGRVVEEHSHKRARPALFGWIYRDKPAYVIPFKCQGHSLTNMQYVKDDHGRERVIVMRDGGVYSG